MPLVKPSHMPVNGSQIQSAAEYASPLHIVRKKTALRCIGAVRALLLVRAGRAYLADKADKGV